MAAPYHGSVTVAQDVLSRLVQQLHTLHLPPLGPKFKDLSGDGLANALVSHRLTKKFAIPSEDDARRRIRSIESMLEYDSSGPITCPALRDIPLPVRRVLLNAKNFLADLLCDFRVSNTARFPSGESHQGSFGWVDAAAKLASDVAWEVSLPCVESASGLCYNNAQLKRLVKRRFRDSFPDDRRPITWYKEAVASGQKVGFYVFTRMFLACNNIVGTSRVATVPKDSNVDRVITCEPFWNMMVQLSLAQDLRTCLTNKLGINLSTAQTLHRSLIAHDTLATIDFSNASNSNWLCWLRFLWPPRVLKRILYARTGVFEYTDHDGEVHFSPVNMLAPMGCGYTFEVMTITLLAIGRVLDSGTRVFGDDVIIAATSAQEFMGVMDFLGWKVNTTKTFVEGNFRESCGGFYSLPDRCHLVCFDLWYPKTIGDVFVSCQKLEKILVADQISGLIKTWITKAYIEIVHSLPRDAIVAPQEEFSDAFLPTRLWRWLRNETHESISEKILKGMQWDNHSLYRSYTTRMQSRAVKPHEHFCSTVLSFYAMRSHDRITSRKKESKLVRTTCVAGAHIPLQEVGFFTVLI